MTNKKRKPPIACRPSKKNEWLYDAIEEKAKGSTQNTVVEQILVSSLRKQSKTNKSK